MQQSNAFMDLALEEARAAATRGEVPVGAVVIAGDGTILARAGNRTEEKHDATAHAEILALREASEKLGEPRLEGCTLVVTLEPCAMCAAAISFARIRTLVYGAADTKGGAVDHGPRFYSQPTCHHAPDVFGGVNEAEAAALLKDFFREKR